MAHFIGFVLGARGEASRLSGKETGIQSRVQGWKTGVKVIGRHIEGQDQFMVFATGGSDKAVKEKLIAIVRQDEAGTPTVKIPDGNPVLDALDYLLDCIGAAANAKGGIDQAVEQENLNEAVARARKVVEQNSGKKVEQRA